MGTLRIDFPGNSRYGGLGIWPFEIEKSRGYPKKRTHHAKSIQLKDLSAAPGRTHDTHLNGENHHNYIRCMELGFRFFTYVKNTR